MQSRRILKFYEAINESLKIDFINVIMFEIIMF